MIIFKSHEALKHIKQHLPSNPIVVEAGAFNGNDTQKMANLWPKGTIHTFEPVPEIFVQLKKNTAHLPNVHCHQLALSDQNGTAQFHLAEKPEKPGVPTQAGSLRKPKKRLQWSSIQFPRTINVQTITLDSWVQQNNIDHVDFLWLDIQGQELDVLKTAPHILPTVKVIYTEVSFIESYENQPLCEEVKTWLEQHGFKEVGRDFTDQKKWFFGNALFVQQN